MIYTKTRKNIVNTLVDSRACLGKKKAALQYAELQLLLIIFFFGFQCLYTKTNQFNCSLRTTVKALFKTVIVNFFQNFFRNGNTKSRIIGRHSITP